MTSTAVGPLDRSRAPEPAARRPFRFPELDRRPLAGGAQLLMAPVPGCGLVQLEIVCPGGAVDETAAVGGRATLAAALLDEGTSTSSAIEIAARAERAGGAVATAADWDAVYLSAAVPADRAAPALALLAELAHDAVFPQDEVERLKRQRQAELRRRAAQPAFQAAVTLVETIYGEQAYGHSLLGSQASVAALDREQLLGFARRRVGPAGSTLLAVGDLAPERLAAAAAASLEPWRGGEPTPPAPEPPPAAAQRRVIVVDRPQAAQTELRCGHAGIPRSHPDFVALQLLNALLGGKFTSRLNLSLRERHGVTYGAHSRVSGRLGPGPIVLGAAVATEAAGLALGEMVAELERLRAEPVSAGELADAREYLLGVFPHALQTVAGVARRLETLAVYGLADDYWSRYLGRIQELGAGELLACARRHLHPESLVAVAVGPARALVPQLEEHGELSTVPGGEPPAGAPAATA